LKPIPHAQQKNNNGNSARSKGGVHQKEVAMGEFYCHHCCALKNYVFSLDLGSLAYFACLNVLDEAQDKEVWEVQYFKTFVLIYFSK
jgi:hypothetical protein